MKKSALLVCVLLGVSIGAAQDSGAATGGSVANELCVGVGTFVKSPVEFATHGECMTYLNEGGTLFVVSTCCAYEAFWEINREGRVVALWVINETAPENGLLSDRGRIRGDLRWHDTR
jgi:hypothetical protein